MIDLSVVIVNWNTKEYLIPCVKSISEKGEGISKEVIVVDNGSQDGSANEVKKTFPFVHLIENERNLGFARASNQGLQKASGKYALLLNPDTWVRSEAIEQLVSFMDTHIDAGAVGAQLLNGMGAKQNSIANFPSLATELLNKSLLRWLFPRRFPGKEKSYCEPIEVDSVIGACMMVRADTITQVGLLDEAYFLFLEETDWCYRMKKAGWKIYHIPQAEIYHFQGKSAEKDRRKAKLEYYRSRYLFFKKHKGWVQFFILLIGLVVKLVIEMILTGAVCLFTFFSLRKWRKRLSLYVYLLWWHLRFCPEATGLKSSQRMA